MKFKEMQYTRPDLAEVIARMQETTKQLEEAKSFDEADKSFLAFDKETRHIETMGTLSSIRHSIDTRDKFYDAEDTWWNNTMPQLQEYQQQWIEALLVSPFRSAFGEKSGRLIFVNAEIAKKAFSPEIIP